MEHKEEGPAHILEKKQRERAQCDITETGGLLYL